VHHGLGKIAPGYYLVKVLLVNFNHNAPINVKAKGGGQATHGNLTVMCIPRVRVLII